MPFSRWPETWLRLTFRWSNSTQTWRERIGDLAALGGLVAAVALTFLISFEWWQLPLVWGICLLPALAFSVMGWLKVFGPVLYYDMIRQARRSRFIILRFLYALLLVFLLFSVALSYSNMGLGQTDSHVASRIAETYFNVFMITQFIMVVLLTSAYVGGAISDEKDRKTLEFMLATDLLNREIVLSKLGSRLANLGLVVLTGLPILSVLQFLGGVDPNLVLAGFALTAMTVISQASVSIYCSVLCKKPRESIALSYLALVAYYAISIMLLILVEVSRGGATEPFWFGEWGPSLEDVAGIYNMGNLFSVIIQVQAAGSGGALATTLPKIVTNYALFHGVVTLACTALAVARLRRVALAQSYGKPIKARRGLRLWNRPRVGSSPMLWKEINCDGAARSPWIAWIIFTILLVATFIWPALILIQHLDHFYDQVNQWSNLAIEMNAWVRTCNVIVGCLTLMAVGVRASTAISSEREKQTFDTLLTTPLDSTSILSAKWAGSMLGVRFGIVWLGMVWMLGTVTGGLHPVALLLVIAAWLVYAAFAATLGLWFSATSKSSLRATVWTIMTMIVVSSGHWLIWMCCGPLLAFSGSSGSSRAGEYLLKAQAGIMTPGFVMGFIPFSSEEFSFAQQRDSWWIEFMGFSMVGLVAWSIAAGILYAATSARFRLLTRRESEMFPDRSRSSLERNLAQRERQRGADAPLSPSSPPVEQIQEDKPGDFRYKP